MYSVYIVWSMCSMVCYDMVSSVVCMYGIVRMWHVWCMRLMNFCDLVVLKI